MLYACKPFKSAHPNLLMNNFKIEALVNLIITCTYLRHFFSVSSWVQGGLCHEHWMLLWLYTSQLSVQRVMPDLLNVIPVGHDTTLYWVAKGQNSSFPLSIISDIAIFHRHAYYCFLYKTGPEVIKLCPCSTQLSTKFILLINVKMPTIVGILTFISRINTSYESLKAINTYLFQRFSFYEQLKLYAQLS